MKPFGYSTQVVTYPPDNWEPWCSTCKKHGSRPRRTIQRNKTMWKVECTSCGKKVIAPARYKAVAQWIKENET